MFNSRPCGIIGEYLLLILINENFEKKDYTFFDKIFARFISASLLPKYNNVLKCML